MSKTPLTDSIRKQTRRQTNTEFNNLIGTILSELPSQSPQYSGFFASSWTASTHRPRPDQAREDNPPWSEIEPSYERRPAPAAFVEPRFANKIKYNFKLFSKVYIGNRSEYAASALGSTRSKIPQYIQGQLRPLVNAIFTDKKAKIAIGARKFKGGQGGIGPFADPDREFVDYTNL